jgi:hypothetical protein
MKINIIDLLSIFDELLPLTNEEEGTYWLKISRNDEIAVTLAVSIYENKAAISIYGSSGLAIAGLHFINCQEVKVLDENRKCLEILHDNGRGRCFLSLLGNPILEYKE